MSDDGDRQRIQEASEIFLRLRERPDDSDALERKAQFLARGAAEIDAWNRVVRVWRSKPPKRKTTSKLVIALLALSGCAALWAVSNNVWSMVIADAATGREPEVFKLATGDTVHLDASSAIQHELTEHRRHVSLMNGTAFFDVLANPDVPFTVTTGRFSVGALGTAFEVSMVDDELRVAVSEGRVAVSVDQEQWVLSAGQRGLWSGTAIFQLDEVASELIAPWREDRLVADGLTLEQAVGILDSRIAGSIVVVGESRAKVSGTFDLTNPASALRSIAAVDNATVVSAPPVVTFVYVPRR